MEKAHGEIFGSFFLGHGEFALPVQSVQEVVHPPEALTPIPLAPNYLPGFFNLRGTIVPVIDLKIILAMKEDQTPLQNKKVAILDCDGVKVGLLIDRTGEIFRLHSEEVSAFSYRADHQGPQVVSGAIKLDSGRRILQVLDINALVKLDHVPQAVNSHQVAKKRVQLTRKQCISFLVEEARCGFEIECIHEIIQVPEIKPSPFAVGNCIGLFHLRDDVVPLIDFASLLKYREPQQVSDISTDQRVIILKIENERFGLLVKAVESIVTYFAEDILPLPTINSGNPELFTGFLAKNQQAEIVLLNSEKLFSSEEVAQITHGHSQIFQSSAKKNLEMQKKRGLRKSYITFKIDNLFGLGIDEVKEVIEFPTELLKPPRLPEFIKGMINLRGKMIAVLDVRLLYGADTLPASTAPKIMIFEQGGVSYGMIVDSVESIVSFAEEDQIMIPQSLYRGAKVGGSGEDVKFAVEIMVEEKRKTLLVLNLEPLAQRIGLGGTQVA